MEAACRGNLVAGSSPAPSAAHAGAIIAESNLNRPIHDAVEDEQVADSSSGDKDQKPWNRTTIIGACLIFVAFAVVQLPAFGFRNERISGDIPLPQYPIWIPILAGILLLLGAGLTLDGMGKAAARSERGRLLGVIALIFAFIIVLPSAFFIFMFR